MEDFSVDRCHTISAVTFSTIWSGEGISRSEVPILKKWLFAALALAGGLLFSGAPAHAAILEVDTDGAIPGSGPNKAVGTFHVVIDQGSANTFRVVSIRANSGPPTPNSDTEHFSLSFLNAAGDQLPITGNTTGGVDATGTNYGSGTILDTGVTRNIRWDRPVGGDKLDRAGSNRFATSGFVTVSGAPVFISVLIANGARSWSAGLPVGSAVPEPASLALVLPGLVPLAMTLRRRRASSRKTDAETPSEG